MSFRNYPHVAFSVYFHHTWPDSSDTDSLTVDSCAPHRSVGFQASDGRFEPGSPRLQDEGMDEMAPVTRRNLRVRTIQLYVLGWWEDGRHTKSQWFHVVFQIFAPWKLMDTFQVGNSKRCFICGCCMLFRNVRLQALTFWRFTSGNTVSWLKSLA